MYPVNSVVLFAIAFLMAHVMFSSVSFVVSVKMFTTSTPTVRISDLAEGDGLKMK